MPSGVEKGCLEGPDATDCYAFGSDLVSTLFREALFASVNHYLEVSDILVVRRRKGAVSHRDCVP